MKKSDLIKQIEELQEIKPEKEWLSLSKRQLLAEISTLKPAEEMTQLKGVETKTPVFVFSRSYKIASVLCAIMLLFSGIIGLSQSASIGNPLYSVKIGLEKGVIALAPQDLQMDLKINLTEQIVNDLAKSTGGLNNQLAIEIAKKNLDEIANQLKNISHPNDVAIVSEKVQQKTSQIKSELQTVPVDNKSEVKNSIQELGDQVKAVELQAFALKGEAEQKINNCPVYLEQSLNQLEQKIDQLNLATDEKQAIVDQLQKASDYVANNHCVDALVILDNLQKQLGL